MCVCVLPAVTNKRGMNKEVFLFTLLRVLMITVLMND